MNKHEAALTAAGYRVRLMEHGDGAVTIICRPQRGGEYRATRASRQAAVDKAWRDLLAPTPKTVKARLSEQNDSLMAKLERYQREAHEALVRMGALR